MNCVRKTAQLLGQGDLRTCTLCPENICKEQLINGGQAYTSTSSQQAPPEGLGESKQYCTSIKHPHNLTTNKTLQPFKIFIFNLIQNLHVIEHIQTDKFITIG